MKTIYNYILIVFSICIITSCMSTQQYITKNKKATEIKTNTLFKKNGNAFYIYSTHSSSSVIWSYRDTMIEIYKLNKGRVFKELIISHDNLITNNISFSNLEDDIYNNCALQLDGDVIGLRLHYEGKEYNERFPVDINCLKDKKYGIDLLNIIIGDINKYDMWNFETEQDI